MAHVPNGQWLPRYVDELNRCTCGFIRKLTNESDDGLSMSSVRGHTHLPSARGEAFIAYVVKELPLSEARL
jgi:hypothetical protein